MATDPNVKLLAEPLNKLLVPPASAIGSTLQDLWELVFGGFGMYVEKKRFLRAQALADFKASLETKVAAIPEAQLSEPPLAIVGPALEASKYYFEEPKLREMFANLISASMDSTKVSSVLPSFTEIIKQLTSLDAQNLLCFNNAPSAQLPIAEYRFESTKDHHFGVSQTDVFLSNPLAPSIESQSVSISTLIRLGLVSVAYDRYLLDESLYAAFYDTAEFKSLSVEAEQDADTIATIQKGIARLTPLGRVFVSICLPRA